MFKTRVCAARSSKTCIGRVDTTKTVLSNMLSMICRNTMLDLQQHCTFRPVFPWKQISKIKRSHTICTANCHAHSVWWSLAAWKAEVRPDNPATGHSRSRSQSSNCHGHDYNESVRQLERFQAAAHALNQLQDTSQAAQASNLCERVYNVALTYARSPRGKLNCCRRG